MPKKIVFPLEIQQMVFVPGDHLEIYLSKEPLKQNVSPEELQKLTKVVVTVLPDGTPELFSSGIPAKSIKEYDIKKAMYYVK